MKKILIVTRYDLIDLAVRGEIPTGVECVVTTVDGREEVLALLRQDGENMDVIVVTDLLGKENWQNMFQTFGLNPEERKVTIMLRAGLDESKDPYDISGPIFASVHGRTKQDDPNSLRSKLAELLGK